MMNDDRFDDILQEAAREHNSAPETPRAEMWAAIAAARGAASAEPAAPPLIKRDVPEVRVIPLFAGRRRAIGWAAALAATLVLGVVIGRRTASENAARNPLPGTTAHATPVAPGARVAAASAPETGTGPGPVIPMPSGPSVTERGTPRMVAAAPNGERRPGTTGESGTRERTGPTRNPLLQRDAATDATLPYRMAAVQHLATTEALLVSLRSDVREGRTDTTIAVWAGDLLGTTRMLIDSPAGRDPQLKQLLEDLELVLAQISRLPGAHGQAADLGLIDDAVRRREIMTRLRALSPNT